MQQYLASERSERDTYRGKNEKIGDVYWRASEASETVLGVDNAKSGICYLASERSERDSIRGG